MVNATIFDGKSISVNPAFKAAEAGYNAAFGTLANDFAQIAAEVIPTSQLYSLDNIRLFHMCDEQGNMPEVGEEGASAICFVTWRADGNPDMNVDIIPFNTGLHNLDNGTIYLVFSFLMSELADKPTLLNTFRSALGDLEVRIHGTAATSA